MRSARWLFNAAYGLYAVLIFTIVGVVVFLLVTIVPGLRIAARQAIAHIAARIVFFVIGVRVILLGKEHLPAGPCVVIANHASYIDGVLLKAFLPARFSFVIKKEVTQVPLAGPLLRRIGSEFVDRFNRNAGAVDARRLIKAADAGQALALFPEGTFHAAPGIGKFHTGAFVIAARAGIPIVPVALRGTRRMLPSGRFLPRLSRLRIDILPPIYAGKATLAAQRMRDEARARIVATVEEPDLSDKDGLVALHANRKS